MKRFVLVLSLLVGVWMLGPTPEGQSLPWSTSTAKAKNNKVKEPKKVKGGSFHTPELDPSAAGGAMVLLLGGVAYIASRRREDLV